MSLLQSGIRENAIAKLRLSLSDNDLRINLLDVELPTEEADISVMGVADPEERPPLKNPRWPPDQPAPAAAPG